MAERWVDEARVTGGTPEDREKTKPSFEGRPTPDVFRVEDLEKSAFERQAWDETMAALNVMLKKSGLPEAEISPERIHVLSQDEFHAKVMDDPHVRGKTQYGQVYVIRDDRKEIFLHDLTHETAHLASYLALNVSEMKDEAEGGSRFNIGLRRLGHAFQGTPSGRAGGMAFNGLNEAVTEYLAHDMRKELVAGTELLDDRQKDWLRTTVVYASQISVLKHLIEKAAGGDEERAAESFRELYRDHVTGEYAFLKNLSKKIKGSVKALREMDVAPEDAIRAARQMGFDDLADALEET